MLGLLSQKLHALLRSHKQPVRQLLKPVHFLFTQTFPPLFLVIEQRICVVLCSNSFHDSAFHDARGVNEGGNELLECSCVFVHSFVCACGAVYRALLFRKREHGHCVPADMRVTDLIFPLVRSFLLPSINYSVQLYEINSSPAFPTGRKMR